MRDLFSIIFSLPPYLLIATTSAHANFPSILHKKTTFFYFTHQFLQNTHISLSILHIYSIKYSFFYNFLLFPHSLPLSLTYLTLPKNTKILNVILVHLCTILHPLIWVFNTCTFMHNFTPTDMSFFFFLGSKCVKWTTFYILQDFAWADAVTLRRGI